jgi:hypothetical protein
MRAAVNPAAFCKLSQVAGKTVVLIDGKSYLARP